MWLLQISILKCTISQSVSPDRTDNLQLLAKLPDWTLKIIKIISFTKAVETITGYKFADGLPGYNCKNQPLAPGTTTA